MKANRLMKLVTVAIAAALFLGPVPTAMATPSSADARLAGRVFDKDLVTPAASLTVAATSLGAKAPAASSRTDKDGRFELAALPAGYYDLLISDAKGQPLATARDIRGPAREAAWAASLTWERSGSPGCCCCP